MAKPQNNICDRKKRYKANAYVIIFNTIIFYKLSKKPSYMSSNKTIILPFCVLCYKLATIRQRVSQNFKIFPISFDKPKKEVYYVSVTNTMQGRVIMTLYIKRPKFFTRCMLQNLKTGSLSKYMVTAQKAAMEKHITTLEKRTNRAICIPLAGLSILMKPSF